MKLCLCSFRMSLNCCIHLKYLKNTLGKTVYKLRVKQACPQAANSPRMTGAQCLLMSLFIVEGCHDGMPQAGWFQQWKCVSHYSAAHIQHPGAGTVGVSRPLLAL